MIARMWRCTAARDKVADYVEHFKRAVFPELSQIDGYREAYILRRDVGDNVELTVMTLWESLDAIRKVAGENIETAVIAPAAQAILRAFDTTYARYEVLVNAGETQNWHE